KDKDFYYGFGTGSSKRPRGSMKDPNFNPWPEEEGLFRKVVREEMKPPRPTIFDNDEDDLDVIEHIMSGRRQRIDPASRPGASRGTARDLIVGQTLADRRRIGNRRSGVRPVGSDGDKK
ncbi:MAG: hypothetical protein IJS68_01195, partial [Clostridia bacterium]|nr:hypothetical protein [Clostridia bacterium]